MSAQQTHWPWTDPVDPKIYEGRNDWPKISIVTPSYNQGQFIEETILSVLNQNYPNLEYIIIDGGSTDDSVEIIRKYEQQLKYWVAEPDMGQSDAINKGLAHCTGDIFNWINSDDLLASNALFDIAQNFDIEKIDFFAGVVVNDFDNSLNVRHLGVNSSISLANILKITPEKYYYHQPGVWFKRNYLEKLPQLRTDLFYYFDWDYMLKYLALYDKGIYTDKELVLFRAHNNSKTISMQSKYEAEILSCYENLYQFLAKDHALKSKAKRKFDVMRWHNELQQYLKDGFSISKLLKILSLIACKPKYRLTRFSIGLIRNMLIKQ